MKSLQFSSRWWLLTALLLACPSSARAADEQSAIFVMRPDGSEVRKLAQVDGYSDHAAPRWSHDGKHVAFEAMPAGGGDRSCYVVDVDGTNLRQVATGQSCPDWSPDDKQLAVHEYPADSGPHVIVQNLDGQGRVDLGPGMCPRWSPDGSRLAVGEGHTLRIVDMVTSKGKQLFDTPVSQLFHGCGWSPDGKRLAVAVRTAAGTKRQLVIVNADGSAKGMTLRDESSLGGHVSFSPDGKQLVFSSDNTIHIIDVEGTTPSQIVAGQQGKNRNPHWSPDGQWIVFASDREQK